MKPWIESNRKEVVAFFEDYLRYQEKLEQYLGFKWDPQFSIYTSPDDISYEISSSGNLITLTSLTLDTPSSHLFVLFHRQVN